MLPGKDDDRRDKMEELECVRGEGVRATSLKQPEKLLNCQRSVRPRRVRWGGGGGWESGAREPIDVFDFVWC